MKEQTQNKKVPLRTCVGCGQTKEKAQLIRVIRRPDGTIMIDRKGKVSGRGAYLCDDPECLKKALKKKSLSRALQTPVPEEIRSELEQQMASVEE